MRRLLAAVPFLLLLAGGSPPPDPVASYRKAHEHALLREYLDFLSIPNVASDQNHIRQNAEHLMQMMDRRGLNPRLLTLADPQAPPAVYGEWTQPGATHTLLFYAHFDGQPTDPAQWHGSHPWQPVLRTAKLGLPGSQLVPVPEPGKPIDPEWRIYARSASDDKAGVMAILAAVEALRASRLTPRYNLKFFFEGEEEAGSPHLADLLTHYRELFQGDAWIICDGPVHQSGRKQVVFGVRGDTNVDLTVYGANAPLHSGHYGNWAPNPGLRLTNLLASMKDSTGHVTIEGWYDDVEPLGERERQALAAAPAYDQELRQRLGFGQAEGGGQALLTLITQPSLNINGMHSGDVGELARNVIPTTATAVLDLRLVRGNDHVRQVEKLRQHVRRQGYHVIDHTPTDAERAQYPMLAQVVERPGGYNAARTPMDLPIARQIVAAVQSTTTQPVVQLPTGGGSLPLVLFQEKTGAPTITVPIANFDNNQHAEDENIRLQNLWDGIDMMAALMMQPDRP
ncbi:Acetylornithine deacetylase/Succinyl-diaminopimelate desuccinylase [Catalinimonas alkaloidigena]|uniref:Acetylornithine deacetylase/Succinyl-diaminopimelate desuccinylase n=1 Tax=Catalinimonas alkaloidigena TaxID=1075417 RepID=A0A1G9HT67_9BACT|nr:M20/M25/M40 family metallo-hydrolase [Catalinimonas alkaloidigena]SDL16161.1 Acetylornithine deacetylase/Succinyl-diaminopimelate desuccinylase [Catalinimonas alkaloidigena]